MTPEREAEIRQEAGGASARVSMRECLTEIDRLRAELAKVRAEREWRDIATAPKDGTPLLMWRDGIAHTAAWRRADTPPFEFGWGMAGWRFPSFALPTHWQPLPPAPSETRS